jgi:DNA-binding GntR family transcriptional regulator
MPEPDGSFGFVTLLPDRTLGAQIAVQLRDAIAVGALKPGQRIVEHHIARSIGTSRGPVREALKMLQNEGLVARSVHRGTVVTGLSLADARELWTLREALELLAVDYLYANANLEQLDELDRIVDRIALQMKTDFTDFESIDIDVLFHHTLCKISGHKLVLEAFDSISGRLRRLLLTYRQVTPGIWIKVGVPQHREIAAALRHRPLEETRAILRQHMITTYEAIAATFEQKGDSPPRT